MSKKKQPLNSASRAPVNLAPGFAVLALAAFATALGFAFGAKLMPFGGVAVAACIFSAVYMIQRKSVAPGYASFFIAVPAIAAAMLTPL